MKQCNFKAYFTDRRTRTTEMKGKLSYKMKKMGLSDVTQENIRMMEVAVLVQYDIFAWNRDFKAFVFLQHGFYNEKKRIKKRISAWISHLS